MDNLPRQARPLPLSQLQEVKTHDCLRCYIVSAYTFTIHQRKANSEERSRVLIHG